MIFLSILIATTLVGLLSFVGAFFFLAKKNPDTLTFYFVSLASGTMLGNALLNLIPEAMEHNTHAAFPMIGLGVFIFFILEKFLIWRHCHSHHHTGDHQKPIAARMIITGDAIHNFIDGAIIASSFLIDFHVGLAVTAAIVLHEIPQELGDFGILIRGGYSVKNALGINALTASTALLGAVITYFFLEMAPLAQHFLVPVTAGGFLYIALADLIPQLHEHVNLKESLIQMALLLGGFGFMAVIRNAHG
ncbi:MAG: Zinc transporter ZupT [Elusimicrobia bacterium]|nr:Zinc transporter ZupT [Elusimicrobiota bacterium]